MSTQNFNLSFVKYKEFLELLKNVQQDLLLTSEIISDGQIPNSEIILKLKLNLEMMANNSLSSIKKLEELDKLLKMPDDSAF